MKRTQQKKKVFSCKWIGRNKKKKHEKDDDEFIKKMKRKETL